MENRYNFLKSLLVGVLFLQFGLTQAQVAKTQVLSLQVIPSSSGINITWPNDANFTGTYSVYGRPMFLNKTFEFFNNVPSTKNTFLISTGGNQQMEFLVTKTLNGTNQSIGYIWAGNNFMPEFKKNHIVLLIDSQFIHPLKSEIQTLENDLMKSGWKISKLYAGRNEKPLNVKSRLKSFVDAQKIRPKTLYIIGHIPVPYSGFYSSTGSRVPPDGHIEGSGNHTGAWPADLYYGDLEGIWSDYTVDCTTGSSSRHHNKPNDGKFDQSTVPSEVELEIGRVDFYDLPVFNSSDTALLKDYLNRVHEWKMGNVTVKKRALIDNNFLSLNLASTGYHNFPCFVGIDSVNDQLDYFTAQTTGNYLWSYGCGAGSYNSCNGIGTSTDFSTNKGSFSNIFTVLAGSFFGDWDSKNNLLRSSLAGGSLASCWGGIPKWYLHHMGLGMNIGYGAKITQNNSTEYFNGAFNQSDKGVFIALMGDPTLTMNQLKPVKNLTIESTNNGAVKLRWSKSSSASNYIIYRIDTANFTYEGAMKNCGSSNTTDTFFVDECNWGTGTYLYGVAASKLDTTGSGTYWNQSLLEIASVQHTNSTLKDGLAEISISPNPAKGFIQIKNIPQSNETKITINGVDGRIWLQKTINNNYENQDFTLPIPSELQGLCIVTIESNLGVKSIQLILN